MPPEKWDGAESVSDASRQPKPALSKVLTCCQEEGEQQQRMPCHPARSLWNTEEKLGHVPSPHTVPSERAWDGTVLPRGIGPMGTQWGDRVGL